MQLEGGKAASALHTCAGAMGSAELPYTCPHLAMPQFLKADVRESQALTLSSRDEGHAVGAKYHYSLLLFFTGPQKYFSHLTAKSLKDAQGSCARQMLVSSSCFPISSSGPVLGLFKMRPFEV